MTTAKITNSEYYLDTDIHDDYVVCGKRLQPLSLKRYIRLELLRTPQIITNETRLEWIDFEKAVALCSHRGKEPMDAVKFHTFSWFKKIRYQIWHLYNFYFRDIQTEYVKFMEYFSDYSCMPEMEATKEIDFQSQDFLEHGATVGSNRSEDNPFPWYLIHQLLLIKKTGWTQEYIENLPLSKIVWLNEGLSYLDTGESRIRADSFNSAFDRVIKERAELERLQELTGQQSV